MLMECNCAWHSSKVFKHCNLVHMLPKDMMFPCAGSFSSGLPSALSALDALEGPPTYLTPEATQPIASSAYHGRAAQPGEALVLLARMYNAQLTHLFSIARQARAELHATQQCFHIVKCSLQQKQAIQMLLYRASGTTRQAMPLESGTSQKWRQSSRVKRKHQFDGFN